ncbi:hypothetical protein O3M35_009870 [Rhynocoris fuscipes]|uniref:Cytochrome P450 n=1 Tax=Rhynocoris fuscipes TaxID=488301 RepID=A0AAW1DAE5_9HEMI
MMIEILLILIAIIVIILSIIVLPFELMDYRWKTMKGMAKIHGPKGIPFLGVGWMIARFADEELLYYLKEISSQYKRIASCWVTGVPFVLFHDAEDIEALLGSVHHITKGIEYVTLQPWLNDGLLLSTGDKWHQRRKLLTPAFHFKILENNVQSLNKNARYLLRNMLKKGGEPFIAEEMVTLCTLDVICETAMGVPLNSQDNKALEYVRAIRKVSAASVLRMIKFWLKKEFVFRLTKYGKDFYNGLSLMHSFTEKIIKERKEEFQSENLKSTASENTEEQESFLPKQRKAFLDSLIDLDRKYPNSLTELDIREEVDTFMFEGHDTTSAAIVFTLFLLGSHPDIQEKVYQELYGIFGESHRAATSKDLHEMNYLEKVIKETLRLYPSVPYISRKLTKDLELSGDLMVPEGVNVAIVPYLIHRDERYYPDPEVFDPERFSLENCKTRHPFTYLPFSAGPRNCIGQKFAMMELKVIISTLIRFAKVESVTKKEDLAIVPFLIIRSTKPIMIKVTPRTLQNQSL